MLRNVLNAKNQRLYYALRDLGTVIDQSHVPLELEPYHMRIRQSYQEYIGKVDRNLSYLRLEQDMILEEVLSGTGQVSQDSMFMSTYWAFPILRSSDADRLSLRIIGWMHQAHPLTTQFPPAFADGGTSVWPSSIPVYFLPCIERRGFLYQPLLFHEFGHLLYVRRSSVMDALVAEFQGEITQCLNLPPDQQADERDIVDTWYMWVQEIFCDAVGLVMGGPGFLQAFSTYLSMIERDDFYQEAADLRGRSHPVTWLRIQLLVERARQLGLSDLAQQVSNEWASVAGAMNITEEYHGYYNSEIATAVQRVVDDMLVEAAPRRYLPEEIGDIEWSPESGSIVHLLNCAWQVYLADPDNYRQWETEMLNRFLT